MRVVVVQGGLGCCCVKRVGLLLCRIFERRLTQGSDPTKVRSALAQAAAHLTNQKAKDKFVSVRESNTRFRGTQAKRPVGTRAEPVGTGLQVDRNLAGTGRARTHRSSRRRDCVRRPHITSDEVYARRTSQKVSVQGDS